MAYAQEQILLKEILKEELADIFQIANTSVRSIGYAKPINDMLAVVKDFEKVNQNNEALRKLVYEPKGGMGSQGDVTSQKARKIKAQLLYIHQYTNTFGIQDISHGIPRREKSFEKWKLKLARSFHKIIGCFKRGIRNLRMSWWRGRE